MSFTHRNHYVPQWYQRRFITSSCRDGKYYYLKLAPEMRRSPDGRKSYREKAVQHWGPPSCFYQDDLYTTRFGGTENDEIERFLFGRLDGRGKICIDHFCDYRVTAETIDAWHDLMDFIDAQVTRTPRGLARVAKAAGTDANSSLLLMQSIRQMHGTMWAECVWEIIDTSGSGVDLIVSDNPVTFYNRGLFPGARECLFPLEPDVALLGTQTLFPLRYDRLLVLTPLQFARDPSYSPTERRINPRYYGQTMFNFASVIHKSHGLTRLQALTVNYIVKTRAHQFIAAGTENGLYPERDLPTTHWSKLGGEDFLLPDPREMEFSTRVIASYNSGRSVGFDEYGRAPTGDDLKDEHRQREMKAFFRRQKEWAQKYGPLPHAPAHDRNLDPDGTRTLKKRR